MDRTSDDMGGKRVFHGWVVVGKQWLFHKWVVVGSMWSFRLSRRVIVGNEWSIIWDSMRRKWIRIAQP